MPKVAKELSALAVKNLIAPPGRARKIAVGGVSGLYLQILPTGGKTWILRTKVAGKTRDIGLGGFPDVTLGMARDRAREAKDKIRSGIDPVEEKKAKRAALIAARKRGLTFADALKGYDQGVRRGQAGRGGEQGPVAVVHRTLRHSADRRYAGAGHHRSGCSSSPEPARQR